MSMSAYPFHNYFYYGATAPSKSSRKADVPNSKADDILWKGENKCVSAADDILSRKFTISHSPCITVCTGTSAEDIRFVRDSHARRERHTGLLLEHPVPNDYLWV